MLSKVKHFQIICDNCGECTEGVVQPFSYSNNKMIRETEKDALDAGWQLISTGFLSIEARCPACKSI